LDKITYYSPRRCKATQGYSSYLKVYRKCFFCYKDVNWNFPQCRKSYVLTDYWWKDRRERRNVTEL